MADSSLVKPSQPLDLRRRSPYERWVEDWWLGELLAVLCSCGLTIALCAILKTYDGQPVPSFGTLFNSGITLGTVMALLSTLSVAAALEAVQKCIGQLKWLWYSGSNRPLRDLEAFDEASRGLTGSASLLWRLRATPVASFGALLVIFQLAIAPLAQQSLLYVSQGVPLPNENATVAVNKRWAEGNQQAQSNEMPYGYATIGPGIKGSILGGLFTNVTLNNTAPFCSSGNCTFDDYHSLAICSSVADVSYHLKNQTRRISNDETESKWCLPGDYCITNRGKTSNYVANVTSAAPYSEAHQPLGSRMPSPLNFTSVAFADRFSPIADVYIIYVNLTTGTDNTHGNHYGAVEFVLDWCVPTFSTQVTNGTARTTRHPDPFFFTDRNSFSMEGDVAGTTYEVEDRTHFSLQRYMWFLLSGNATLSGVDSYVSSDEMQALMSPFSVINEERNTLPGTAAEDLAVLDARIANVATGMTNWVRGPWALSSTANGTVFGQASIVHISWGWTAAPIAFTTLSLLFFALVVALSSRGRGTKLPALKSSTVAVLRGLDPQLQRSLGGVGRQSVMKSEAQELQVRLIREGDRWRLVERGRVDNAKGNVALGYLDHASEPTSGQISEHASAHTQRHPV